MRLIRYCIIGGLWLLLFYPSLLAIKVALHAGDFAEALIVIAVLLAALLFVCHLFHD